MDLMRVSDFGFVYQVLTYFRDWPESRTAHSERMNTLIAGELHDLVTYGEYFLTKEEFAECLRNHLWRYYRFLALSALAGREAGFWEYHAKQLAEAGMPFRKLRLARSVAVVLQEMILNPQRTLDQIRAGNSVLTERFKRRTGRAGGVPPSGILCGNGRS